MGRLEDNDVSNRLASKNTNFKASAAPSSEPQQLH